MKKLILCLLMFTLIKAEAQKNYTTSNAHSHNDYEQQQPFWLAYDNGFGSIEADIFLHDNKLIVAHSALEWNKKRSLDSLYLMPLDSMIKKNNGFPYSDKNKELQLMIDIKNDSVNTLNKLIEVLKKYPSIINNKKVKIAISGNRPDAETWINYPSFIWFDGVIGVHYSAKALSKIVMMSDDFKTYSYWNGIDSISSTDYKKLKSVVTQIHALHKKIRFWNAPDNKAAWQTFMRLQVDYINTDHIAAAADFLKRSLH